MNRTKLIQLVFGIGTLVLIFMALRMSLVFSPWAVRAVPPEQLGSSMGDMMYTSALWVYNAVAALGLTTMIWLAKGFKFAADWLVDMNGETQTAVPVSVTHGTYQATQQASAVVGKTSKNGSTMTAAERAKWLTQNHMDPERRREWERTLLLAVREEDEEAASIAINQLTREQWQVTRIEETETEE